MKIHPYRLAWSYKVGRLFGIDIKVHLIFLVIVAFFFVNTAAREGLQQGARALILLGLLLLAVLLHEIGHSLAARRFGIRVHDITLWPLGGMARLSGIPEVPAIELIIALAGPAVNLAFAAAVLLVALLTAGADEAARLAASPFVDPFQFGPVSEFILEVNVWMMALNLAPAFPMDGGRVLRALAALRRPYLEATALAVRVGKILAVSVVAASIIAGWFSFLIAMTCLFVYWAGSYELHSVRARELMRTLGRRAEFRGSFQGESAGGADSGASILEAEVLSAETEPDFGADPRD